MKKPSRILIVDDNPHARRQLKRILSRLDCTFLEAEDGATALALIKKHTFDVVFLDIRLPYGVTGIDVYRNAKKIRADLGKVIILTGWLEDATRKEATELGVFAYLDKAPLDRNKIIEAFKIATKKEE